MQRCAKCLIHKVNRDNNAHEIVLNDGTKEWFFEKSHLENGQHRENGLQAKLANHLCCHKSKWGPRMVFSRSKLKKWAIEQMVLLPLMKMDVNRWTGFLFSQC